MNTVLAVGVALWLTVGAGVALALHRAGEPAGTALLAVGVWPLWVHALQDGPGSRSPLVGRIDQALARVRQSAAAAGEDVGDLASLRETLLASEARLARIDQLLDDAPGEPALVERRATGSAALEAALGDLAAIRLQFALMSVDGTHPHRPAAALLELRSRLDAARELRA